MNITELLERNKHLITIKLHDFHGEQLKVVKYKRKVFYDNLWTPELELCRGLVLDTNDNIVALPFTKIYNYGVEANAPTFGPNEMVYAFRKINGFMVAITYHNDHLLVTTTGSIEGPFSSLAREFVTPYIESVIASHPNMTFLFECCHPSDPHIIPEQPGLYFLGARHKSIHSWTDPRGFPFKQDVHHPEFLVRPFSAISSLATNATHEGYVIYSLDLGRSAKVKSKHYLMSKALARASADKLSRLRIDEEFRDLSILSRTPEFLAADEQTRLTMIRNHYGT